MSKYLCEGCKFNNNGWCNKKKINGLKKLNIQECDIFRNNNTMMTIERCAKDYYGQQIIKLQINNEIVEIPEVVLEKFIQNKDIKSQEIKIPD